MTTCLQCGETKEAAKAQQLDCAIVGGYEYREVEEEWPRHRWADWTDAELTRQGVRPEAFDRHRRTPVRTFEWIGCEDTVRGHALATEEDVREWQYRVGQCVLCGKDIA
jgi:hypothetical protein